MAEKELMSLAEFTAWMAERGVRKGKPEWARRARAGQFGHKIGTQWVVSKSEALRVLESLRQQEP